MADLPLLSPAERALVLALQVYLLVTVLDVLIAWVQTDPGRWPRRLLHALTEPLQRPIRVLTDRLPTDGWDLSPLVVVAVIGAVRVWLIQP
jgi:uncharacterized protein YggT (Ycf19 family)